MNWISFKDQIPSVRAIFVLYPGGYIEIREAGTTEKNEKGYCIFWKDQKERCGGLFNGCSWQPVIFPSPVEESL